MPAPVTCDEFLDLVRKSGVIEEKKLQTALDKLRSAEGVPVSPAALCDRLVREGVLTNFQAEQFMLGKWRRFTIGKYKVLEKLGSGGMGMVYLCEHAVMRRRVAIKVLPVQKAEDPASRERFEREARVAAALDHPNLVHAYDIDKDDKLHFLVMEHVDGASLQEIVKKNGPMDVTRACHYIAQAAVGMQHAHEAGIVHRDLKPGNILIDRGGVVKILDMGLARFFHDEDDILTKKYDENVLGTADYLAPEQALDSHSVDIRADIYSLGTSFYYCLTGRTPFTDGSVAQKLIWHQTRRPKPVREIRHEVPPELAAVLDRMMAKDPKDRYQTPIEVAQALAPWTQTPIPPPPENEMPRLSPAAMGSLPGSDTGLGTATGPGSSATRKNWPAPSSSRSPVPPSAVNRARAALGPSTPASGTPRSGKSAVSGAAPASGRSTTPAPRSGTNGSVPRGSGPVPRVPTPARTDSPSGSQAAKPQAPPAPAEEPAGFLDSAPVRWVMIILITLLVAGLVFGLGLWLFGNRTAGEQRGQNGSSADVLGVGRVTWVSPAQGC
jgi:serine/threonine protein kinase